MAVTTPPRRVAAAQATGALLFEHCDIPADLTIGEWRRINAVTRRVAHDTRPGLRSTLSRALRLH